MIKKNSAALKRDYQFNKVFGLTIYNTAVTAEDIQAQFISYAEKELNVSFTVKESFPGLRYWLSAPGDMLFYIERRNTLLITDEDGRLAHTNYFDVTASSGNSRLDKIIEGFCLQFSNTYPQNI